MCRIASFFSDGNGLFRIFGTFLELFLSRDEVATTGTLGNWECGVAITGYGKRGEGRHVSRAMKPGEGFRGIINVRFTEF